MFGKNLKHTSSDDTTLSVTNFENIANINTFFSNGGLNIQIKDYQGSFKLSVYDITGKQVYHEKLNIYDNNLLFVPLNEISSGIYITKIELNDFNQVYTNKFFVNNN